MEHICKKCLLLEAGEEASYKTVTDYLDTLDKSLIAEDNIYQERLSFCKNCDYLIAGMCRKCGCYVEIRAALKEKNCPDFDNRKW